MAHERSYVATLVCVLMLAIIAFVLLYLESIRNSSRNRNKDRNKKNPVFIDTAQFAVHPVDATTMALDWGAFNTSSREFMITATPTIDVQAVRDVRKTIVTELRPGVKYQVQSLSLSLIFSYNLVYTPTLLLTGVLLTPGTVTLIVSSILYNKNPSLIFLHQFCIHEDAGWSGIVICSEATSTTDSITDVDQSTSDGDVDERAVLRLNPTALVAKIDTPFEAALSVEVVCLKAADAVPESYSLATEEGGATGIRSPCGVWSSFEPSNPLPNGLTMDPATGEISGD